MITKVKAVIGWSSIDDRVNAGVVKVQELLNDIHDTKNDLLGLVNGGIAKKEMNIDVLQGELKDLNTLKKAVNDLG